MELKEAINKMEEGCIVKSCKGHLYKIVDGKIIGKIEYASEYEELDMLFAELNGEWSLYTGKKVPVKEALEAFEHCHKNIVCVYKNQARRYLHKQYTLEDSVGNGVGADELLYGEWYIEE